MASRRQSYGGVDKRGDIQTLLKTLIKMRTEEKSGGMRSAEDKRMKEEIEKKFERLKKRVTPEFRQKYLESGMAGGTTETLAESLSSTTEALLRRSKSLKEEIRRARGMPEEQITEEISSGIEAGDSSTDNDSSVDTSLSSDCGQSEEDRQSVDSSATVVATQDEIAEVMVDLNNQQSATDHSCLTLLAGNLQQSCAAVFKVPTEEISVSISRSFQANRVKSSLCATVILPSCSFASCFIAKLSEPSDMAVSKEFRFRPRGSVSVSEAVSIVLSDRKADFFQSESLTIKVKLPGSAANSALKPFRHFAFTRPAETDEKFVELTSDLSQRRIKTYLDSYCHGVKKSPSKKSVPRPEISCAPVLHLPKDPTGVDPHTGLPKPRVVLTKQPRFLERQPRVELEPEVFVMHKRRPPPRDPTTFTSRATVTTSTSNNGGAITIQLEVLRIVLKKVGPPHSFRSRADERQHHRPQHHSDIVSPFGVSLKRVDKRAKPKTAEPNSTTKHYVPSWRQ